MARRATIFSQHDQPGTLRIAGPYELVRWSSTHPLDLTAITPLIQGYHHLAYDLGVLDVSEAAALPLLATSTPPTWFKLGSHPQTHLMQTPHGRVIAVLFPTLSSGDHPTTTSIQNLITTLNHLRKAYPQALILGISSWGKEHEKTFLLNHEGCCDILLGSGPGPGLKSMLSAHAKTLWTRAYSKGRTITQILIKEFPIPSPSFAWNIGTTISVNLVVLNENIQDNTVMDAILAPLKTATTTSLQGSG